MNNINTPIELLENAHLHIVCLDVPYPVDYGGVFDLFYKIKSLHDAGIKIHLHCFEYGRGEQGTLNNYCVEVNYYQRLTGIKGFSFSVPYIVKSRANKTLLNRLLQDDYPVLMEGIHCTYFLKSGQLSKSRSFVRLHNVEFQYYRQLAQTTTSFFKKMFFKRESKLLRSYEASLANKADFWTVTEKDLYVFVKELGYNSVDYLPLYLPEYQPQFNGERGHYCLYHGNLGVPENEAAATWLLTHVFNKIEIPFVIAGKNPSARLEKLAHEYNHTCIVANPDEREMEDLVKKAQLHVLPSMNETGIKLKLINALYHGRHCVVNTAGVDGSGLNDCCIIANSAKEMQQEILSVFVQPFTPTDFEARIKKLSRTFNNVANAQQQISWIFKKEPTLPGVVAQRKMTL
ncbi:MAG: glycosyltransferase family 4 protein [Bacteroidota bacterium]